MLLLRAFYDRFGMMKNPDAVQLHDTIARCVWKTTVIGHVDSSQLKLDSEVASDNNKDEFLLILKDGKVDPSWKSAYASNFRFFQAAVEKFIFNYPTDVALFAARILNNVILLPIEAESQDTALRIFSTLNDRGLPLSDADIFKSQFYKYYSDLGRKDEFISAWKDMEERAGSIFRPRRGTPMDELFTRYMYYRRALMGIKSTTTRSLRDFYSEDGYAILKSENAFNDLRTLLDFWENVTNRKDFGSSVCRRLLVLDYAPNSMWTYILSVWYMANRADDGGVDERELEHLLDVVTGFVFAYAVHHPGVNALRAPMYAEMLNIVQDRPVTFSGSLFAREEITSELNRYSFTSQRDITKSILMWWAFQNPRQELINPAIPLQVEHIYAKKRHEVDPLSNARNLGALGNKSMLERRVNIRASDYHFADKKKFYLGSPDGKGKVGSGTQFVELRELAGKDDFTETNIEKRTALIIGSFVDYLGGVGLLDK